MLALIAPASASAAPPTRIIVKRDAGLSAAERADIRADAGVRLVDTLSLPRTEVVTAPAADATQAVRELNADPDVVYAELDHVRHMAAAITPPDDPRFPFLWGLYNTGQSKAVEGYFYGGLPDADIDAPEAWAQNVTGAGVHVAVVDTGVDDDNPDLTGKVSLGRTFLDGTFTPGADDDNSHGTHVAGTIAAKVNNHFGVAGVAPGAEIIALKAIDGATGEGQDSDIAEAITYATTPDADHDAAPIVNLSLSGTDSAHTIDAAIHAAPDTLFVVAAGNDGVDADTHQVMPCDSPEPNVICVGASTNRDRRATFSNYGDEMVDLFAPGQDIVSTLLTSGGQYFSGGKDGTSMAAPHVAAAAALVMEADPSLQISDVKAMLLHSVDERPAFAGYSVTGGRLNAGLAVAEAHAQGAPLDDADNDGVPDAIDVCNDSSGGPEGCAPGDADSDGAVDTADNCPGDANSPFTDSDGDGDGNACDDDRDGDGVLNGADHCPDVSGPSSNHGCKVVVVPPPKPTPTPTPKPTPIPDSDGDGFKNNVDACRTERGPGTLNGCPLPAVTALTAKPRNSHGKRSATVTVRTSRVATVTITVQRKRGKRWVRVTRKVLAAPGQRATLKMSRLRTGKYRAVVVVSSDAGRAHSVTRNFRVR